MFLFFAALQSKAADVVAFGQPKDIFSDTVSSLYIFSCSVLSGRGASKSSCRGCCCTIPIRGMLSCQCVLLLAVERFCLFWKRAEVRKQCAWSCPEWADDHNPSCGNVRAVPSLASRLCWRAFVRAGLGSGLCLVVRLVDGVA